jgi:uncharacterized protein YwqG
MSDEVRASLSAAGLASIADAAARHALPSVRIRATAVVDATGPPGRSKIGGLPDLALGQAWPEMETVPAPAKDYGSIVVPATGRERVPLAFVAQFNLADVAPYDSEGALPQAGLLSFFYAAEQDHIFFDHERGRWRIDPARWRILYYDGDPSLLRRASPPGNLPEEGRYRECAVGFSTEVTLPHYDPFDPATFAALGLSERLDEDGSEAYWHAQQQLAGVAGMRNPDLHRLLGHADPVQTEMDVEVYCEANGLARDSRPWAERKRAAAEWRLLLQIDSDDAAGMLWGDVGRIYYWIERRALQRRDFSRAWLVLQCS